MKKSNLSEKSDQFSLPFTPKHLINTAKSYVLKKYDLPDDVLDDMISAFAAAAIEAAENSQHQQGIRSYQYQAGIWAVQQIAEKWNQKKRREVQLSDELEIADEGTDPLKILLSKEREQLILQAIEKLPERKRRIFKMHVLDNLTLTKISGLMGISRSLVYQSYRASQRFLQRELKDLI